MKIKNLLLYTVSFLVVGELLVRLDESTTPFEKDNQVKIAIQIEESPEWKMVQTKQFPIEDSVLRIMVLGDSYIHGAAISDSAKFSNLLRRDLIEKNGQGKYKKCQVLDLSRPANNNLDNYNTYKQFNDIYKPQLVILAYNLNDVAGNLDESLVQDTTATDLSALPVKAAAKPSFTKRLYDVLYVSHVVQFTMHGFNDYLKSSGVVFPNSVFDQHLKAYTENRPEWIKSKELLAKLIEQVKGNDQKMVVLLMPEYNLIDHREIFKKTDEIIGNYFASNKELSFIDPMKYYANYTSKDLRLNKYDGHPNEKAHEILTNGIISYIHNTLLKR